MGCPGWDCTGEPPEPSGDGASREPGRVGRPVVRPVAVSPHIRVPLVSVSHPPSHPSWAFLEVTTNASYTDSLQAYAAGLAEAAVSEQVRG